MWDFWSRLFDSSGFPARWQCGSWTAGHGWLHILSDVGIWSAYFVIPCVLGYYALRRRGIPFRGVLVLFMAFILSCGLTHLMEAVIFWWPAYRLAGVLKLLTAVVSWVTVFALLRVTPRVMAFRPPAELEAEIAERHRAEGDLRALQAQLEERIGRRTAELEGAVTALKAEIEERKGAEQRSRESREQLRLVADNAPVMLVHCDTDRRYRFVNRAYAEINGLSPGDVLGKTIPEVVGERAYELLRANVDIALSGGRADVEVESPYGGAAKRWLRYTFVPHHSDSGSVEGFLVVILDVTERRNAEMLLRTIMDTVPALIAYVDREGRYRLNNRAYEQWFGHPRSDVGGRHMRDVLGESAWAVIKPRFETALAGQAVRYEAPVPYKSGGTRWVDATYTPHLDAGGEVDGVVSLVNDITDKKWAETALRESEARFRHLSDTMPQIVWAARPDGYVDYFNERWFEYTGLPRGCGGGEGWKPVLHPDDLQSTADAWNAAVHSGRPYEIEHRFKNGATGEYRWHMGRAVPVRDDAGGIVRWFGTSTDIHDKRLAEEELRELNATLEHRVALRSAELTAANERLGRSEAMFQGLFQFAPDAILVADADGLIRHANLQTERLFGYGRGEIIGRPIEVLIPERYHEGHRDHRVRFAAAPHTRRMGEGQDLYARHKDGGEIPVDVLLAPMETPNGPLVLSNVRDIRHRKANEDIIKSGARQQAALAEFGQRALESGDLDSLLDDAMGVIIRTIGVDLCRLTDLSRGGDRLVLRAGRGWKPEYVGRPLFESGEGSQDGFCLALGRPVIIPDLRAETRFTPSPHLLEHGAVSGVCLAVQGKAGPHGVLGVHKKELGQFTAEDVVFLQVFANMLGAVIDRTRAEGRVQESLAEKDVLLKEIHHRVKNNLQVVSTLLDLQSSHTTDRAAIEMFKESRGRVKSMALIHERLYRSQDMARVNLGEYVRQLAADLHRTYRMSEGIRLELAVDVPPLAIDVAIPCGLLLNELISNCFKHAFAAAAEGCLRVALHRDGGANVLVVSDDGAGFPAGTDFRNTTSFGLQLVNTMVEQLDGEIALTADGGTTVTVRFPKPGSSPAGTTP